MSANRVQQQEALPALTFYRKVSDGVGVDGVGATFPFLCIFFSFSLG